MTGRGCRLFNENNGTTERRPGGAPAYPGGTAHRADYYYYYYACTWNYMRHMGNHRDRLANLTARESTECRLLTDT